MQKTNKTEKIDEINNKRTIGMHRYAYDKEFDYEHSCFRPKKRSFDFCLNSHQGIEPLSFFKGRLNDTSHAPGDLFFSVLGTQKIKNGDLRIRAEGDFNRSKTHAKELEGFRTSVSTELRVKGVLGRDLIAQFKDQFSALKIDLGFWELGLQNWLNPYFEVRLPTEGFEIAGNRFEDDCFQRIGFGAIYHSEPSEGVLGVAQFDLSARERRVGAGNSEKVVKFGQNINLSFNDFARISHFSSVDFGPRGLLSVNEFNVSLNNGILGAFLGGSTSSSDLGFVHAGASFNVYNTAKLAGLVRKRCAERAGEGLETEIGLRMRLAKLAQIKLILGDWDVLRAVIEVNTAGVRLSFGFVEHLEALGLSGPRGW